MPRTASSLPRALRAVRSSRPVLPFHRVGRPGVLWRSDASPHAPKQIDDEQDLRCCRDEGSQCHESVNWQERGEKLEVREIRVAPGITGDPRDVHWEKQAIYSDQCQREVQLPKCFVKHSAKHQREPVKRCREDAEYCGNTHDQVEMRDN